MLRIGLTGGIGAGKSTVSATFSECGGIVVDGDVIAREVVEPGTEGLAKLVDAFGEHILLPDGALNRPALAAVAFSDDEKRATLNGIVHPLVAQRRSELIAGRRRGCRDRRGHPAAGGIPDGPDVPAGRDRARRRGSSRQAAHRAPGFQRGRTPAPGSRRRPPRNSAARSPTSGWTTRAPRVNWRSAPATCGTSGSCRSRTTYRPGEPAAGTPRLVPADPSWPDDRHGASWPG